MGNKKSKIYKGVLYDSQEEIDFKIFIDEAKEYGFISSDEYHPKSYILIPKAVYTDAKGKTKSLFREHAYTADWIITPTKLFNELEHGLRPNKDGTFLIDVKGIFNSRGGDRIFPIHQKLLYRTYGLIVNKIVPELFFTKINIIPEGLKWKKNIKKEKTPKKAFRNLRSFEEVLAEIQQKYKTGKQINLTILKE